MRYALNKESEKAICKKCAKRFFASTVKEFTQEARVCPDCGGKGTIVIVPADTDLKDVLFEEG